jgi:hypothetical protein
MGVFSLAMTVVATACERTFGLGNKRTVLFLRGSNQIISAGILYAFD